MRESKADGRKRKRPRLLRVARIHASASSTQRARLKSGAARRHPLVPIRLRSRDGM